MGANTVAYGTPLVTLLQLKQISLITVLISPSGFLCDLLALLVSQVLCAIGL